MSIFPILPYMTWTPLRRQDFCSTQLLLSSKDHPRRSPASFLSSYLASWLAIFLAIFLASNLFSHVEVDLLVICNNGSSARVPSIVPGRSQVSKERSRSSQMKQTCHLESTRTKIPLRRKGRTPERKEMKERKRIQRTLQRATGNCHPSSEPYEAETLTSVLVKAQTDSPHFSFSLGYATKPILVCPTT